jgi:hypothetical protein
MGYTKNAAIIDIVPVANQILELYKQDANHMLAHKQITEVCRDAVDNMDIEYLVTFMHTWSTMVNCAPLVISGKITYEQYIRKAVYTLPQLSIDELPNLNLEQLKHLQSTVRAKMNIGLSCEEYAQQLEQLISQLEEQEKPTTSINDICSQILNGLQQAENAPPMPAIKPAKPDQTIEVVDDFTKVSNGLVQLLVKAGVLNKSDDGPIKELTLNAPHSDFSQIIKSLMDMQQRRIDATIKRDSNADVSGLQTITLGIHNFKETIAAVMDVAQGNDIIIVSNDDVGLLRSEYALSHNIYTIDVLAHSRIYQLRSREIENVFIIGNATKSEYMANICTVCYRDKNQKIILID